MSVFIIADIAQAHEGSLGILHSYIDAVSKTDVDAIKFQTHIAEAESSIHEPFRVKFSYVDKTRYDYWKRMEFTLEQWKEIKTHCEKVNLEFLSSPFSIAAVKLLEELNVRKYKIGSGEITNHLMLEMIAKTGKEIMLSSGISNYHELDAAIDLIKQYHNRFMIFQCTSKYPTSAKDVGLNVISEFQDRYKCDTGLSDHSGSIYPSLAAVALGAKYIEVHACFDKQMFGPDSTSSLTMEELKQMTSGVRFIDEALASKIDKDNISEMQSMKAIFEKSLAVNCDLQKGSTISFDHLEAKKPAGYGIKASYYKNVIGKKLKVSKAKYDFLTEEDLI
ncbi:N-acetylneuraminate synthase family protein [bacterium]|nr:N-acetylneuraminate synthase family protein [bacterium]